MGIFKKRKKRISMCSANSISEQEYVDQKLADIENNRVWLTEKIEILQTLNEREHIFINPTYGNEIEEKNLTPADTRKWAKENNYEYIQTFDRAGELWTKKKK